jgi:hypothetical protein
MAYDECLLATLLGRSLVVPANGRKGATLAASRRLEHRQLSADSRRSRDCNGTGGVAARHDCANGWSGRWEADIRTGLLHMLTHRIHDGAESPSNMPVEPLI